LVSWPSWILLKYAPECVLAYVQVRALAGGTTSIQGWAASESWVAAVGYLVLLDQIGTRFTLPGCAPSGPSFVDALRCFSHLADEPSIQGLYAVRNALATSSFDEVFRSDGTEVICTPIRAPKANAFAERWVRTVRTECLDWMLILGRRHLERVLGEYVEHYQRGRPHRGLALATPIDPEGRAGGASPVGAVRRRDLLGGLIHEYSRPAA
jgi:hypothetical protein